MNTRKRSARTAPATTVAAMPAYIQPMPKRARALVTQTISDNLLQLGFTLLALTPDTWSEMTTAAAALHSRVKVCGKQPWEYRLPGYSTFPNKQRLALQAGTKFPRNAGIVQHISDQVMLNFDDIARDMLAQLAESLQLPFGIFNPLLGPASSNGDGALTASLLDTINYMSPEANSISNTDTSASCEAHIDRGLLTILFPDTVHGLQVQKTADGAWENLLVPEGYVAVLAGHTLEHATCGMVKAVKHRVVMGVGGCQTERNVVAYKLRAQGNAVIDTYSAISSRHASIDSRSINCLGDSAATLKLRGQTEKTAAPVQPPLYPLEEEASMYIAVTDLLGNQLPFKVCNTTPVSRVLEAYMSKKGISWDEIRFMYDGQLVLCSQGMTVADHNMESGDLIHAIPTQCGD